MDVLNTVIAWMRKSSENAAQGRNQSFIKNQTVNIDWIPALGFGFLRRPTDYIHVVEGRDDD